MHETIVDPKELPRGHVRMINVEQIKRDQLRNLLEADPADITSTQAEALADDMMAKLKAGESVDTSAYGPEVALMIHDEEKRIAEVRADRARASAAMVERQAKEMEEREHTVVAHQAAIAQMPISSSRNDERFHAKIFSAEETMQIKKTLAEAAEKKKRREIAAEPTMVIKKKTGLRKLWDGLFGSP
jgi:hypothetical protein